jgi:hypothetical protein
MFLALKQMLHSRVVMAFVSEYTLKNVEEQAREGKNY